MNELRINVSIKSIPTAAHPNKGATPQKIACAQFIVSIM